MTKGQEVTPMSTSVWIRTDRVMRTLHLYTSMFLVPWMVMYAVSGFLVNHHEWFMGRFQPKWEVVQEQDFEPGATFPQDVQEQASEILRHVDLEGRIRWRAMTPVS